MTTEYMEGFKRGYRRGLEGGLEVREPYEADSQESTDLRVLQRVIRRISDEDTYITVISDQIFFRLRGGIQYVIDEQTTQAILRCYHPDNIDPIIGD